MIDKRPSQKNAVFEIIKEVLGPLYSSETPMRPMFSSGSGHDRHGLNENIQRMDEAIKLFIRKIQTGEIAKPKNRIPGPKSEKFIMGIQAHHKENYSSDDSLKRYARNIIFNWLNKDSRLNGGKKYNPTKNETDIFHRDSVMRQLNSSMWKIKNETKNKSKQVILLKDIEEMMKDRKQQLSGHGENLYLVARCITNEAFQNLIKKLISNNHEIIDPFLDRGSMVDIESVIIKIIELCKKDIVDEIHFVENKKSA